MISAAEEWLNSLGIAIEDQDFGREDEPMIDGCALIRELPEGLQVKFVVRPGLASDRRAGFAQWCKQRLQRFQEHGPEPDGWQRRSDGDWQLWVRSVELPRWE